MQQQAFRRVLEALRIEWQNSAPRFASTRERRRENINVNNIYLHFHFLEGGTNPQPVDFIVTLCASAPRLAS